MPDDKSERQEVEVLIRELSSSARKPMAGNAGASQPAAAPSVPRRKRFISAISLRPAREKKSFLPDLNLPEMPQLKLPGLPKPVLPAMPRLGGRIGRPASVTVVRMCVGLGVLLSLAMPYWPYPKACAWWLLFYLFAVALVVVAGIWSARLTWNLRLGVAHVVALGIVLWGITLAAEETLPRIGYAKAEAVWWCPS